MKKGTLYIRGARLVDLLQETPLGVLQQNTLNFQPPTKKRQFATAPVQVRSLILVPMRGQRDTGDLKVEGTVVSGPNQYEPTILFHNVTYEDADRPDNITFTGYDKREYHILPIDLARSDAEVRCTCLDFYFTFSKWNQQDDSLYGEPPEPYTPKTDRASRNPMRKPGLCKHLLKVTQELRNERVIR